MVNYKIKNFSTLIKNKNKKETKDKKEGISD